MSAVLSSASMHDSLAAIPLSLMTAQRVTNCYDLMDAADCSSALREHSRSLGHGHFDAEIPISDVCALHFKNSCARSSIKIR